MGCVIQIPMIHLSQKSPEYLKLTGTSTLSWLASGQGNTRCDLGESRSWYDVDTQSNTTTTTVSKSADIKTKNEKGTEIPSKTTQQIYSDFFSLSRTEKRRPFSHPEETLTREST